MSAVSLPLFRPGKWTSCRPEVSLELVALLTSVFLSVFCNGAFWHAYAAVNGAGVPGGWMTTISLFVAITGLNMLLLCVLLTRWSAKPVLATLLLVTAFAVHYMNEYMVYLDPDMIRNVLHTESKESRELITPGLIASVLLSGVMPIALVWRVRLRERSLGRALWIRAATLAVTLAITAGAILLSFQNLSALMRNHPDIRHLITPGNYLVSLARVASDDSANSKLPRLTVGSDARVIGRVAGKPRLLVIVVGETVRAGNWGLNGYARQTTPELSSLDVLNYSDVTACGSSTEVSLPCMFSVQGRRNYDKQEIKRSESLLHVLERAGISTLWRDNQTGCKGVCDQLAFESYLDARIPAYCDDQRCFDEVLLHDLARQLGEHAGDQVVVLHQLGNHGPSYSSRYPAAFRRFTPTCETAQLGDCSQAEVVNAYDNAILYTDHFLGETIRFLQAQTARDTAMIYVSDHGESLGENNLYLHGVPYPIAPATQLKVPMVMWLSPGFVEDRGIDTRCMRKNLARPASHDNLFSTILGLMQVQTRDYDKTQDLFASCTPADAG